MYLLIKLDMSIVSKKENTNSYFGYDYVYITPENAYIQITSSKDDNTIHIDLPNSINPTACIIL